MKTITSLHLADTGVVKFNEWFGRVAREGVRVEAVAIEMCDQLADRISMNESLVYELGPRYTVSGRPELIHLDRADVDVTEEDVE